VSFFAVVCPYFNQIVRDFSSISPKPEAQLLAQPLSGQGANAFECHVHDVDTGHWGVRVFLTLENFAGHRYGVVAVHTRDVLQQAIAREHASSAAIRQHLTTGSKLSDSVLTALVLARLSQLDCQTQGWVLTGFPRTAAQTSALDRAKLAPNRVFFLAPDTTVVRERVARAVKDEIMGKGPAPSATIKSSAGRVMDECVFGLHSMHTQDPHPFHVVHQPHFQLDNLQMHIILLLNQRALA
jgi:adenylate kinase family enzyme